MASISIKIKGWYCPRCKTLIPLKKKKEFVDYVRVKRVTGIVVEVRNRVMLNKQNCKCDEVDQDCWKELYIQDEIECEYQLVRDYMVDADRLYSSEEEFLIL